jgi:hypothetical protein
MLGASVVGGYLGARLGQRLPGKAVRGLVVVLSAVVTAAFFARAL